jgi:hypothetical protein
LKFIDADGLAKILTIYVQQPKPGSDTAYSIRGTDVEVGHTFIGLRDTDTGQDRRVGLYPSKPVTPGGTIEVPGAVTDDSKHEWNVKADYTITDKQYEQLSKQVDSETKPGGAPKYNLNTNNCTDYAIKKAATVGVKLPDSKGTWPLGGGSNPGKLGEALRKQKKPAPPPPPPSPPQPRASQERR